MPDATSQTSVVIGVAGLSAMLQTSERTVDRLNSTGRIPRPSRLGELRWRRAEVEAWISAGMPDRKTWERSRRDA